MSRAKWSVPMSAFGRKLPLNAPHFRDSPRQPCVEKTIQQLKQPKLCLGYPHNLTLQKSVSKSLSHSGAWGFNQSQ